MRLFLCVLLLAQVLSVFSAGSTNTNNVDSSPSNPSLFGINMNWWVNTDQLAGVAWPAGSVNTDHPYNNTVLHNFLKNIQSTITRYPGGTTSSFWNVSSSSFVNINSPLCKSVEGKSSRCNQANYIRANNSNLELGASTFSIQAYGERMHAAGIPWMYVANLFTTTEDEVIAAIESICANENVACPDYLELGNEYYLSSFYETNRFPTADDYLAVCLRVYNAVKNYFPGRIAAIGSVDGYISTQLANKQFLWNRALYNYSSSGPVTAGQVGFDHITVHTYALNANNLNSNPSWTWPTIVLGWGEAVTRFIAERHIDRFPAGTELWYTEFNYGIALSTSGTNEASRQYGMNQVLQPAHGLNIAGTYLAMLRYPKVYTKAMLFESIRDQNLTSYNISTDGYQVYAPGQIFSHLAYIMQTHDEFKCLDFDGVDLVSGVAWYQNYNASKMSALQGALFTTDSQLTYVIINRVNYSISIDLPEAASYSYVRGYVYPRANETVAEKLFAVDISLPPPYAGPMPLVTVPVTAKPDGPVELLPFSMYVLTFTHSNTTTTTGSTTGTTGTTGSTTGSGSTTAATTGSGSTTASEASTTGASSSTTTSESDASSVSFSIFSSLLVIFVVVLLL